MPKQVDHDERRRVIAEALWRVVDQQGILHLSMREVANEAGVSLGQVQHYFSSRAELLGFAMELQSEQTSGRAERRMRHLGARPHPRDVLRILLTEMLPLRPDTRTASRLSAAYVLTALHDEHANARARDGLRQGRRQVTRLVRQAIADGHIAADRDPVVEANLLLALTGFTPLLELDVISPHAARTAVDQHLDRLFDMPPGTATSPGGTKARPTTKSSRTPTGRGRASR
ncbi:MAG TPA: TetR family transcriptional regulator C-terminal domain-containing protein [Actinocatenispora sp.]